MPTPARIQFHAMSVEDMDTNPARRLEIPAEPVASPSTMPPGEADMQWWKPGWRDLVKHVGWKWLLALPAVAIAALIFVAFFFDMRALAPLWMLGAKLIVL